MDDDPGLRELLLEYLAGHGFSVGAVADGRAMGVYLAGNAVDLVILDLMKDRKFNRHPENIFARATHRQEEICPQSLVAPCNIRCLTMPEARKTPAAGWLAGLGHERARRAASAALRYHAIR